MSSTLLASDDNDLIREDAPDHGFPKPKYVPLLRDVLQGFEIFYDCASL